MRSLVLFSWTGTLLTIFANPLPSDMLYNDFYESDPEVQGGSLFGGDTAPTDPSLQGLLWEEPSSQDGSLWASGGGNYDILPQDGSQDPTSSANPDLLLSSCGGTDIQTRDQMRTRGDGLCSSADAPLSFKIPTLTPLVVPKTSSQTEIKPTLGRLRLGPPLGNQDRICSVEPYENHLCCDGPIGDEALEFGDLEVFTPVRNCIPGTVELRDGSVLSIIFAVSTDGSRGNRYRDRPLHDSATIRRVLPGDYSE